MPKICVEIELDTDSGQITVGTCDPKEDAAEGSMQGGAEAPEPGEQSFHSNQIDQAMQAAKTILTGAIGQGNSQMRQDVAQKVWPKQGKMQMAGMGGSNRGGMA